MPHQDQKRKFYRIHYNPTNCPFLRFQGSNFEILDLSEEGFKFKMTSTQGLELNLEISGALNFRDGESFLIHGFIRRLTGTEVSLFLKNPIPLRKIMAEQRLLIQKQKVAS